MPVVAVRRGSPDGSLLGRDRRRLGMRWNGRWLGMTWDGRCVGMRWDGRCVGMSYATERAATDGFLACRLLRG
jgi:hypothetical protein